MKPSLLQALGRLSIDLPTTTIRSASTYVRYKKPRPDLTHFPPGWGEQIWVWKNVFTRQVIYSHKPVLDSNRALRQLPFNGKKSKPAKLRKDYWTPMALIQFAPGQGVIGQSVFQKLREFRLEHELTWGWQEPELRKLRRRNGHDDKKKITPFAAALNSQQSNSVADMAAVLGGAGRGNRIWVLPPGVQNSNKEEAAEARETGEATLAEATVYWADITDREEAESWPANVKMIEGLPPLTKKEQLREELATQSAEMSKEASVGA